jgi:hypothetical protein
MKVKGRRFETVSDIQSELHVVLDSIKGNDFHGAFEMRKETMGSLCTFLRRIFWRKRQTKLSNLKQHFFLDLVRELSDVPHTVLKFLSFSWIKNSCCCAITNHFDEEYNGPHQPHYWTESEAQILQHNIQALFVQHEMCKEKSNRLIIELTELGKIQIWIAWNRNWADTTTY